MEKIVRMMGGLANRMFQYSFSLYLRKLGFEKVYVDNYYKPSKWKMEEIEWERIFPNAPLSQASKIRIFLNGGGYDMISKLRMKTHVFSSGIYKTKYAFELPSYDDIVKYNYFIGIFQNSEYISSIEDEIHTYLKLPPFQDSKNIHASNKMLAENSVAIHVRKGLDYQIRNVYKGTCPSKYYMDAVSYIKEHVESPVFYVFTDNKDWVAHNLKGFEYKVIDWNPTEGWGNHFDMQLMSNCKHNIIANSTYSWWAAFLNENKGKIVVGPTDWFNKSLKLYSDTANTTLCKDWIKL